MVIRHQGDIYWVELDEPTGSEPGYSHPHVVVQNNVFNASKINTVIVCALTSNLKRAQVPGNLLLEEGEGNLPKQSVILVSQIFTVDKSQLGEFIGKLSERRVRQILEGIYLMTEPRNIE
ncbi:MAG: type II toxin-antitoxin system PemK/MazF family toxin [Chloroflexota bacterium]